MLVNAVKPYRDASTNWETCYFREQAEIPVGVFAVIIKVQTKPGEGLDGYVYRSDNTLIEVIGTKRYEEVVIKRSFQGEILHETIVFWSNGPFVLIESWESPQDGKWIRMACRVRENGLSMSLPDLTLPTFHPGPAGRFASSTRAAKWCRLNELAAIIRLPAAHIVNEHARHFEGHHPGLHIVSADDKRALAQIQYCDNVSDIKHLKEMIEGDLSNVWVRRRFALVVTYFHLVGWHDEPEETVSW
ncbi:hypothetical protein HON52_01230 [Candidatus Uhrbacteria bacterium]|jgi:hypothetical protein|nr:hypothetical protein [Candidatus Uhrbacteria bacterium]